MKRFKDQLTVLEKKAATLGKAHHTEASEALVQLHKQLLEGFNKYEAGTMPKGEFKNLIDTEHTNAINKDSKLKEHRGWTKLFFYNLGLALAGIGIFYIAALIYNQGIFQCNTDSINQVDEAKDLGNALCP